MITRKITRAPLLPPGRDVGDGFLPKSGRSERKTPTKNTASESVPLCRRDSYFYTLFCVARRVLALSLPAGETTGGLENRQRGIDVFRYCTAVNVTYRWILLCCTFKVFFVSTTAGVQS